MPIDTSPLSLIVICTGRLSPWVGKRSTQGRKISPWFHARSNVATPYMAIAPWAKLMTPEPLYTTTRPVPSKA